LKQPAESEVSRGLAVIPPAGAPQSATLAIGDLDVPWLPLPSQVTGVTASGDWRYDAGTGTVFSARDDTQNLQYSVQFVPPHPSAAELEKAPQADASLDRYRELPTIPAPIRSLTESVIARANNPFDEALAIQNYLTGPLFHYDLTVDIGDSTNALETFLLTTRRGFCQQFAAAMAVMARIAGIPSRVAVGFTRGTEQPDQAWVVTTRDAHAWPELYFPGYGWLAFEPTPRGDGQAQPPSYTTESSAQSGGGGVGPQAVNGSGGTKPHSGLSKNQRLDAEADQHGLGGDPAPVPTTHHSSARGTAALVIVILLGVALVTPSLARVALRRRRWKRARTPSERASAAWAELRASAIDAHVDWIDGLTPRATTRLLQSDAVAFDRMAVAALDRIVTSVQRAWYSRDTDTDDVATDQLADDVATVREAMFVRLSAPTRLARHLWPRSVIGEARAALGGITMILDAIDLAGARLRARMRPRRA
jgi:transglutaminase-like putative cysteine protease